MDNASNPDTEQQIKTWQAEALDKLGKFINFQAFSYRSRFKVMGMDMDDIKQELQIVILNAAAKYRPGNASVATWCKRAALYKLANIRRKAANAGHHTGPSLDEEFKDEDGHRDGKKFEPAAKTPPPEHRGLIAAIDGIVAQLPPDERAAARELMNSGSKIAAARKAGRSRPWLDKLIRTRLTAAFRRADIGKNSLFCLQASSSTTIYRYEATMKSGEDARRMALDDEANPVQAERNDHDELRYE